jgi:hypothetical protein
MRITLCASIAFYDDMQRIRSELEQLGHEVKIPPSDVSDEDGKPLPVKDYYTKRKNETDEKSWVWQRKEEAMRLHFGKVAWSDAVLVLNLDKNGVANYVGANTFLEMGIAFHMKKKIFLYNPIPEIACKEEILGMRPEVIYGDLEKIS